MATEWTSDKIYDRCAYLNCYNGKYSTGHKLFRFPAYSDPRHHLWIRYAGNVRLRTWASATIRRAGICGEHFPPESFTDETRQSLRRRAVPNPYSATDARAKPSSILLAQINSLPRKQMKTRRMCDSEKLEIEFEARSQKNPDADEPKSAAEKPTLVEAQIPKTMKTLRKVKRIKIEERISNTNRTIILERCKNPETCPANSQTARENGKPRLHFHKVYVENAGNIRPIPKTYSRAAKKRRLDDNSRAPVREIIESFKKEDDDTNDEPCDVGINSPVHRIIESFKKEEDNTNDELSDVKITKTDEKPNFRMEKIHIDLAKSSPKKEETSTTSRYTGEPEDLMSNWQAIQEARAASELEEARKNNRRKLCSNELTKEGRAVDRCVYINCKNGRFTTGAHLFRFPQINDPRLVTWMKNAGNPKMLDWTWSTIRCAGLCADHFTKDSFFNETRHRLLRTAVPKPFFLEKNGTGEPEDMSQEDLLKIFALIDKERKNGAQNSREPGPIDLPREKSQNRENLVMRYSFEDPEMLESDNEAEMKNFNVSENEERVGAFTNVTIKTEMPDPSEDEAPGEIFATTSGLSYIKEEPEEDPLDDATNDHEEESEDDENTRNVLDIHHQKARLCKVIKQFSTKLKNAKNRKHPLRSRLRPRDVKVQSFG